MSSSPTTSRRCGRTSSGEKSGKRIRSERLMKPKADAGTLSIVAIVVIAALSQPARAQGWNPPPPEKRCPSQWGANDERGAANLQTPQAVLKASQMIREGRVYELGKVLDPSIPRSGARSYSLNLARTSGPNGRNQQRGNEETVFTELGQIGTQYDGLAHQALGAHLYNCVENDAVAARTGFTVLVRTGWGRHFGVDNALFMSGEPGIGIPAAEWLAKRNIMMVGSDNWAVEIRPYPDKGLFLPVHGFLLVVNGIFLLENLDLEAMSRDKVYEFALIVQPLKLKGGTGSTVVPMAVR